MITEQEAAQPEAAGESDVQPEAPPPAGPEQAAQAVLAMPEAEVAAAIARLVSEQADEAPAILSIVARQGGLSVALIAITALGNLPSQQAADTLNAIGGDRSDAQRAKEARRALHKLSLAGIKPQATGAAPQTAEPDKVYACLASPVDMEGTRSVTIVRENRFGTLRMAVFVMNETVGIADVMGADPCSMSLWKRYQSDAARQKLILAPVELAFAQRQIETAVARSERSKLPLPQGYYHFSSLARGESRERPRPPELSAEALRDNSALLARSADLLAEPECQTWSFTLEEIRPAVLRVIAEGRRVQQMKEQGGGDMPVLDLSEVQRSGAVVSMAMNEVFDGARRSLMQERLEYTADLLWREDKVDQAQWAAAAALALAPESNLPVEQHPFLRQMMLTGLEAGVKAELAAEMQSGATSATTAQKPPEPEEYVDEQGMIRRKSGLILPR